MRIAIATTGRFHVLDLARELAALGHDVSFYSCVPRRRSEKFGLSRHSHKALWPFVLPLFAAARKGPAQSRAFFGVLLQMAVDRLVAQFLKSPAVFIGMSGLCVRSAKVARARHGAKVFLERGSRHILSQLEILESLTLKRGTTVPKFNVRRELWGYDFADFMVIPSRHAELSFLERGISSSRLFRNPYGVDLSMFPATVKPKNSVPTLVYTGTWSVRKGCDLLTRAIAGRPWKLVHVGSLGDAEMPQLPNIQSRGVVPQAMLAAVYAEADAFVLASREEGLSLVQAQAIACGVPVVCTDKTGGMDLAELLGDTSWISVVPSGSVQALVTGIELALARAATQSGLRDFLGSKRCELSWHAYAMRYQGKLLSAATRHPDPATADSHRS